MRGGVGLQFPRLAVDGPSRVLRAVLAAAAAVALLHPAAAMAQSSGCSAVNARLLDFNAVLVGPNANQPGTTSGYRGTSGALSMMRTTTSYTDNVIGSTGFVPDDTTTYSFTTGDRLEFTADVSAISVLDPARIRFRAGLSTGGGAYQAIPARANVTTTGTFTGYYEIPSGLRAIAMTIDNPNGNNVTTRISVLCIPFVDPGVSLGVTMAHSGSPAQNGTVDYTITPSANGNATGTNLTLTFTLPTGLSFVSGTGLGWSCTSTRCSYTNTIGAGGTGNPLTLRANVAISASTSLTPSVSLSGGNAGSAATASDPTTITQVAATVTVAGGNSQSAATGTAFATPLSVTVRDAGSVVIPNATVTFTAPATGASGSFSNTSNTIAVTASGTGVASSGMFTANATAGAYSVSAAAGAASATFALTNTAATAVPTVTGIAPASGPLTGGGPVVITGTGLTGATAVSFGSTAATGFTVDSATQITATAPAASAGVVDVTVTTPGGTSATNASTQFTYAQPPAAPTITATPPTLSNSTSATFQFTLASGTAECAIDNGSYAACTSPVTLTGLSEGAHSFQIRAVNGGQTSSAASHSWTIDSNPPAAPVVTTPANGSNRVVSLRSVTGTAEAASTVTVYLDGASDGTATADGSGNWTHTLTTLTAGSHALKARASDAAGNSSTDSATSSFTAVAVLAAAQASPSVTAVINTAITTVQPVTVSGGLAPISYALSGGTLPSGLAFDTTTGQLSGTPTTTLGATTFTVTATDALSQTAARTFSLSVGNASQTIAFTSTAPVAAVIGGATYTPSATATSSLTVAFTIDPTSNGICAIAAGVVSFTGAGTCRISADQPGNASYAAATQVQQSFAVSAGSQTIAFTSTAPVAAVVGGATYTPSATATSSLTVAFTIDATSNGICTIAAGVVSFTGTGTCRINADQPGNASYAAATQVQQSFTVSAASQTIGFTSTAPVAAVIGGATYTPSATATSALTVAFTIDPASNGICAIAAGVVSFTGTGTCRINADQPGNASYAAATQVQQSFTVSAASQTIGFTSTAPVAAVIGGATYTPSATATSALTVAFTIDPASNGICAIAAGVVSFTGTGTCRINADQPGNASYAAATQVQQSFAVSAASQTIAFTSTAPVAAVVGGATYTPSATATSTLTVAFTIDATSNGICTIAAGVVSFTGTGACRINADQPGNASYAAATEVQQSFTVSAASQTIGFTSTAPVAAVIGGATYTPGATATSALTVAFTIDPASNGICAIAAGVVSFTGTGTCRINADQPGNASYAAATQVQQSFTVSAASQTISFTSVAPVAAVVGGATYTPSATATSSLTVAFTIDPASNGICTIAGGVVSFTGAGTCRINADQPGNASYAAATQVQQSFTVSAASQTIAFTSTAPVAAVVGGATYTPSATATSGLPVAFTIDPASNSVCTIAAGVVSFTGAGTCRINADQPGNANYDAATQVQQSFAVTVASQTISFATSAPGNARVGGAPYSPAATATSGLPVDLTIAPASSAICTLSGGNVTFSAAGTCLIDANQAGNASYAAASLVQQSVTVAKGDQTVSFAGLSNASLSASPLTLSATAGSGLAVEFASGTTGICTVAGTTLSLIAQGTCTVTADQPGDTNWNAAPTVTRSFSVLPATLALSSNPSATAVVGAAFSQDNTVTGGVAPYQFTLASGALPAGASLDAATGAVRGTLTSAGAFSYAITVADSASPPTTATGSTVSGTIGKGSQTLGFTSTPPAPAIVGGTYTVTAQSSATLTPVFTIAPASVGLCAVTGATVTFTAAGSCIILADQAGTGNYDAAPQISQSVTVLAAPTAADRTASIAYDSTGTAIDLTASIGGGAHDGVAIVTAPAHGTASVAGDIVTYTPTAGYFGADSFTYSATGPGGTSAPATVSVTVATPAVPTAAAGTVDVGYDSAGQAIPLQPSGVYTTVAIATAPTKGTVTLSGTTATYVPTPGSFGADSFTYTATGPGGTSAPATISVTIATPATPGATGSTVDVAYDSAGQAVTLQPSGVYTTVAIASAPTKGTVSLSGTTATYVPAPGSFGADSFTYTATGPGGTSAPATVSVTVATPATPGAAGRAVDVAYDSTGQTIPLQPNGVYTTLAIATAPTKGTVTLNGTTATYVPTPGSFGADSFTYTATGPGGTSAPATVSVTIATPATPRAAGSAVDVAYDSAGQAIALQPSGVFTTVAIATAPTKGTATLSGTTATYVPTPGSFGADSFTYTATGPGGTSAPATVSVTIATPATPGAAGSTVDVAYDSAGQTVTLQPSGVYTTVAIATGPTKGTVTLSGTRATYVPTTGSFGVDSFTYTSTGPGGTSAPATINVTIATPATPGAAGSMVDVAYDSAGQAIALQPSGVYTTVAIATAPTKGTVMLSGTTATYVPTPGSFGADSFTYTATGPGGTSAPATISVTIATPATPGAAGSTVDVAYESAGQAIALQPSGVFTTVAIATAPTKGTVTLSGTTATYIPTPGSFGADSFTYTATGPGGTSPPATVSVTIDTPATPGAANLSADVAFDSAGQAIVLQPSGVYSSVALATAPTKGSVTISGATATYVPTAGSFGSDSFTYIATGPGGNSPAATVNVTIAAPPVPVAEPVNVDTAGTTVEGGASVGIDLAKLVSGTFATIEIAAPPAHGTVTLRGPVAGARSTGGARALAVSDWTATYEPNPGYAGKDSFQFVAVGPGGRSVPATVEITVTGQAPTAQAKSASIGDAQTVSVELTEGAIGGPFTAATIDAVSPAEAATARIVQGGTAAQPSYRLDVTTAAHFGGTVVVRYRIGNAFGLSAAATVTITVTARPDPSADPVVRAISDAQAETARRFARTQVSNFMARTQQLHHGGGATNPLGIAVNLRDAVLTPGDPRVSRRDPALSADRLDRDRFVSRSVAEATLPGRAIGSGRGNDLPARDDAPRSDAVTSGPRPVGDIALWTGGSIEVGTLDRRSGRAKITLASGGLSTGADLRIADWATIGLGGGYGSDVSRIDGEAARIRSETKVFAAYGSFAPVDGTFVDAMIGHGNLDYRTRRAVAATGEVALGKREGGMTFGAVSAGVDRQNDGLRWSGYGRLEWLDGTLDGYSETGVARYALRFDDRSVRSLTGVVGGRFEIAHDLGFARVSPRIAAEWLHEFQTAGVQSLDYADFSGLATYRIRGTGWQREQYQLSLGSRWSLMLQWMVDMEIGLRGAAGESAAQGRLRISKRF
jgi:uncharacterized protein YhjY with autotransporter beta-barrel domain